MNDEALPNNALAPTTESVSFFAATGSAFLEWLTPGLDEDSPSWVQREVVARKSSEILTLLHNRAEIGVDRYLVLSQRGWTAVLNNAKLGTDMGIIPSLAAREMGCVAIRATAVVQRDDIYGATILEVFDPAADLPLRCRRVVSAANDGGRWQFDQFGEPFSFEDEMAYTRRGIRNKFTPDLLKKYLDGLNVPAFLTSALGSYSPRLLERERAAS